MEDDFLNQNILLNEYYYNEREDQTLDELTDWLSKQGARRNVVDFLNIKISSLSSREFVVNKNVKSVSGVGMKKDLRFYSLIQLALIAGYVDKIDSTLFVEISNNLGIPAIQRFCIERKMLLPLILYVEQSRDIHYDFRTDHEYWRDCFSDFFNVIIGMQRDITVSRYLKVYDAPFFHDALNKKLQALTKGQILNNANPDLSSLIEGFFKFLNFLPALAKILKRSSDNVILHSGFLHYLNDVFPITYLREWLPDLIDRFIENFDFSEMNFYKINSNELKRQVRVTFRKGVAELHQIASSLEEFRIDPIYDVTQELFEDYFSGDLVSLELV